MSVTHTQERVPAAERVAVRCVDSDVHPVPKRGQLVEYIPEPWRSKYFLSRRVGDTIYYDAPDYAHSYAMRADTFPPDGEFPGSDPDMAFRQLIMEAGADLAILDPTLGKARLPVGGFKDREVRAGLHDQLPERHVGVAAGKLAVGREGVRPHGVGMRVIRCVVVDGVPDPAAQEILAAPRLRDVLDQLTALGYGVHIRVDAPHSDALGGRDPLLGVCHGHRRLPLVSLVLLLCGQHG